MVFQSSNLLSSPGLAGPQCFSHIFGKLCLPVGDAQKGSQVKRAGGNPCSFELDIWEGKGGRERLLDFADKKRLCNKRLPVFH